MAMWCDFLTLLCALGAVCVPLMVAWAIVAHQERRQARRGR
jgi:hypothetical protein